MTEAAVMPDEVGQHQVLAQLRVWRERLIDLTARNPLLGINRSRTSKLRVTNPPAGELFAKVALDGQKLRMPLIRRRRMTQLQMPALADHDEPADWQVRPGDVDFEGDPEIISRRLRRIHDNARATVEERGVTTLHLTICAVHWTDERLGESVAPLVLIPCTFERGGTDEPLLLVPTDEDPQINPALELYLRRDHNRALAALPDEPTREAITALLGNTRDVLGPGFLVTDEVWLSTFSYETLTIYKDLDPEGGLAEAAHSNNLVRAFAGVSVPTDGDESLPHDLDTLPTPEVLPLPVQPADGSQLAALAQARAGRHVLVYGPPGTGKSQTIANLIAEVLGQGKTVLFVSAKVAALEVVYDRLKERGFQRFCLEAHSTKAGKRRVIDELRRALDAASQMPGVDYQAELRQYLALRERLNQMVHALHQKREPLGRSIYAGTGSHARLAHLPDITAPLPWLDPTTVGHDTFQRALDLLAELQAQAGVIAVRDSHPWRGCCAPDASQIMRERLTGALTTVRDACGTIRDGAAHLAPFLGLMEQCSFAQIERASVGLAHLARVTWLPPGWATAPQADLDRTASVLVLAAQKAEELSAAQAAFDERTAGCGPLAAQSLLADALGRFQSWYRRLWFDYWGWKRQVTKVIAPKNDRYDSLVELAQLANMTADITAWFQHHEQYFDAVCPHVPGEIPRPESLREAASAFEAGAALRRWHEHQGTDIPMPETRVVSPAARSAAQAMSDYTPARQSGLAQALAQICSAWGVRFVDNLAVQAAPIEAVDWRCAELLAEAHRFPEWVRLQQTLAQCHDAGLGLFVEAMTPEDASQAVDLFRRRFWLLWTDQHINRSTVLQSFAGRHHENLAREFGALDGTLRTAAINAAITGAAQRAAQINHADEVNRHSEVGILRRELHKQRPRPLRRLFADIPKALQAIKPCMMMSPVSVSTYLTPGSITFDVVVFDEASQLPTQEAIPAILRARQVVVAGDDKQLPPTSFFSSALFAEEHEDDDDDGDAGFAPLESLLDDCASIKPLVVQAHLRWHYRSRDERLIAFSNHSFYDGDLITFPNPGEASDRGVQLHYVEKGVWDRGRSRTNRVEARVVADLVVRELTDRPERSIGVVALNTTQKEAIEDALAERLSEEPEIQARLVAHEHEPFFVKSLENVQGDERDTIIISVGYGPDVNGHIYLNFGPVNHQKYGWRRLNVLVTRAKHLTILVSSLRSTDLNAIAPENRGATALRDFIAYAERGCRLLDKGTVITAAETNDFEDAVAAALRAWGLHVDQQVGASSFRIDLAVRDPRDPSWYLIGIECDGATYHSSRTARDRDLQREEILRGLGWKLHRIWSTDWFRNPEDTIDAAVRAVERALAQGAPEAGMPAPPPPSTTAPTTTLRPPPDAPPPPGPTHAAGAPYQRTPVAGVDAGVLGDDPRARPRLAAEIRRIVTCESPIHADLVLGRLKQLHHVAQVGSVMRSRFEQAVSAVLVQDERFYRDERGFLWEANGNRVTFRRPSVEDDIRTIEHIPPEELRLAILSVVETQLSLPRDALIRETAQLFGFKRARATIADTIGDVVDTLIENGELRISGPRITLP